jgi:hypothetical protein
MRIRSRDDLYAACRVQPAGINRIHVYRRILWAFLPRMVDRRSDSRIFC